MHKHFPTMLDRPEAPKIAVCLSYCFLAFFSLPFILLLMMQGSFDNQAVRTGIEIAFHVINFLVAVCLFWEYLKESFMNVELNVKGFLKTVGIFVVAIMVLVFIMFWILIFWGRERTLTAILGILPLAEVDLFLLSSDLVIFNPIYGTLCMVILAPVSISCLFYATAFAPVCCNRPWLAYGTVAILIAFPRFCNGITYWDPAEELLLYLVQLPVHLLACWSYQKADTVWAPIAVLSATNLLASVLFLVFFR